MSKSFNWQELLKSHPVFASLDEAALVQLLADEASQEKICPQNSQIVKAGETGESLFLIGSGSVQVTVFGNPIAVLGKGEFFGEIAVLEQRPRSASVTAREQCMLLEITGETFRQLLASHPDIEAQLRATANMRLSQQRQ